MDQEGKLLVPNVLHFLFQEMSNVKKRIHDFICYYIILNYSPPPYRNAFRHSH
jgi:hypothetical protein